jgi:UDP-3-O-[3-hydroxymyristoyl] glucosamine N-acyltransferase
LWAPAAGKTGRGAHGGSGILDSDEAGSARDLHFSAWQFWDQAGEAERQRQHEWQQALVDRRNYALGERCFVSTLASVSNEELTLGAGSYVAAGAYLTGTLRAGRDCTVNAYAVVRGAVTFGNAVRVGAHLDPGVQPHHDRPGRGGVPAAHHHQGHHRG